VNWLIDGYNVIRRDADLRAAESAGLEAGRRALLALVAAAARRTGDRFTVVFDGAPGSPPGPAGGQVAVVFSRPPESADDVLRRLAARAGPGAAVVSSDHAVQTAARRAGCAAIDARAFVTAARGARDDGDDQDDGGDGEEEDDRERPGPRGGNPRRPSREDRAAARALQRLRGRHAGR
jgi:predicted RNA-binding protein with PIN domain